MYLSLILAFLAVSAALGAALLRKAYARHTLDSLFRDLPCGAF